MNHTPRCPLCNVEMRPIFGYPGVWSCPADPSHEFDIDGATQPAPDHWDSPKRSNDKSSAEKPPAEEGYWLAKLGLAGPLPNIEQASNIGDGTTCLPLGELKFGGSSRSGRKRKKKGGKTFTDSPWEGQR